MGPSLPRRQAVTLGPSRKPRLSLQPEERDDLGSPRPALACSLTREGWMGSSPSPPPPAPNRRPCRTGRQGFAANCPGGRLSQENRQGQNERGVGHSRSPGGAEGAGAAKQVRGKEKAGPLKPHFKESPLPLLLWSSGMGGRGALPRKQEAEKSGSSTTTGSRCEAPPEGKERGMRQEAMEEGGGHCS